MWAARPSQVDHCITAAPLEIGLRLAAGHTRDSLSSMTQMSSLWKRACLAPALTHPLLGMAILPGCGDAGEQCTESEVRCEGNEIQVCTREDHDGRLYWAKRSCAPGVCKLSQTPRGPFCARDSEPDARCADGQARSLCAGNEVLNCREGFVESSLDCTTGAAFPSYKPGLPAIGPSADSGFCSTTAGRSFCAIEPGPNQSCGTSDEACDGDDVLDCNGEYATARYPCGANATCAVVDGDADCRTTQ